MKNGEKPVITLKKVKMFKGHDGVGLDCDLYVNGKKVAHVFDDARGGEVEYDAYGDSHEERKANANILHELEEYAKTLPKVESEFFPEGLDQNLDGLINNILMDMEKEKTMKKIQKLFVTHIIIMGKNDESYRMLSYGKPAIRLAAMPKEKLQADINQIKAELKEGERIANTNLQALGITM